MSHFLVQALTFFKYGFEIPHPFQILLQHCKMIFQQIIKLLKHLTLIGNPKSAF